MPDTRQSFGGPHELYLFRMIVEDNGAHHLRQIDILREFIKPGQLRDSKRISDSLVFRQKESAIKLLLILGNSRVII